MTNQEAIKILDNRAIEATGTLGSLPDSAKETSFLRNDIKAYDMAMKALEKQIPKKPIEMKSTDKLLDGYFACPICGGCVGMDEYSNNYCVHCGQKIDWSEEGNTRLDLMRECAEIGE